MAATIDDLNKRISNLETILGDIRDNTGGFKTTVGKDLQNGIKRIVDKIANTKETIITKIENGFSNNGGFSSRNGGNVTGFNSGALKNINDHYGRGQITNELKDINQKIDKFNMSITQALQSLSNNHAGNTNNSNNGATSSIPIDNINKNVEGILTEINAIKNYLTQKQEIEGNNELKKQINELTRLKTEQEFKRANYEGLKDIIDKINNNESYSDNELINYLKNLKAGDEKDLQKLSSKELRDKARKFEKDEEENRRKRSKNREERNKENFLRQKYGYGTKSIISNIATKDILNPFNSLVNGGKPEASKIADNIIGKIPGVWGGIAQTLKGLFDLGAVQDRASTNYARVIGGNNQAKYNIGETVRGLNAGWDRKGKYGGYRAEDAYSALTEMAEVRGRTIERQSQESVRSLVDLKRFGIGTEAINNFDTFGKSVEQTDKYFAKLYNEVSKKGLSFKTVSKAVNDNLKAAQSHTFANGLRGLEQMAERSVQLKYNMQQVFQFADKVSEIEGAIGTAANLSVLGGSFAQYSNPMQLLYEGLNNSEALQKRIEGMFGDKAFYNSQTKQIDMSALDKEFVKQAAKAAGLDANEMLNMSYNNARLKRIEGQIQPGLRKDTVEYIKNIAELDENGNGIVNIGGQNKMVFQLTEEDRELLEKESRLKDRGDNAKLGDVYMTTSNISEQMDNILSYLQEKLGRWVFSLFQIFARRENGRQELVMDSTSDETLRQQRIAYYNEHSLEKNAFWGKRGDFARDIAAGKYDREIRRAQGKSPNGFSPLIPGNSGIYNGQLKGGSHLTGGILGKKNGVLWEAENNEWLINGLSSLKYKDIMPKIQNGTFNPYSYANDLIKNDMGKHLNSLNVAPVQNKANSANQPNSANAINGKIKVDIPQTITIKLEDGTNIGELDTNAITSMVALKIMQEWKKMENLSGFNKEDFPYKNVIA